VQGVTAKDVVLAIIGKIGTAGGTGYTIEFGGSAIRSLSMEGRMTVCNMAIEAGARAGLVAVDEKTIAYCKGRHVCAHGRGLGPGRGALAHAAFRPRCDTSTPWWNWTPRLIQPQVTWGTSPEMVVPRGRACARPGQGKGRRQARSHRTRAGLHGPGAEQGHHRHHASTRSSSARCTNSRIEDLREAAAVVKRVGQRVAGNVKAGNGRARLGPGEGAGRGARACTTIFKAAGFEWREPGCSMCLAMNADKLEPGERCASTSNRNFEGRQGNGGRTHLVSPAMAAAAALHGHFVDVRRFS
jgi:3-isopropylmalate/(R)-2-methylmalate dehydratase large subunit